MKRVLIPMILGLAMSLSLFVSAEDASEPLLGQLPESSELIFGEPSGEAVFGGLIEMPDEETDDPDAAEAQEGKDVVCTEPHKIFDRKSLAGHILGADNRVTINNTMSFPYSAIGYIEATGYCGCNWTGTGFVIGKHGMLTAAHCLVCQKHGQYAQSANFYFGVTPRNGGFTYEYAYNGRYTFWVGTTFQNGYTNNDMNNDYGYILFQDDNVGDITGCFGLYPRGDIDTESMLFSLTGYKDYVMKTDMGFLDVVNNNLTTCQMDALPGNSGSPVYDSNYYVSGIWIAYSTSGSEVNYVYRLQNWLINEMISHGITGN